MSDNNQYHAISGMVMPNNGRLVTMAILLLWNFCILFAYSVAITLGAVITWKVAS